MRYLVDRGYPKESAAKFVADHFRLLEWQRFVLIRVVVASAQARMRRTKLVLPEALRGKNVFVDGYNVLIAVESIFEGCPVYLCDDGFLRDIRGIFRSYRRSEVTGLALSEIIDLLASVNPAKVEFLLDKQISMSGNLAAEIRETMAMKGVPGTARTANDVDHQLKVANGVVATGDGNVIDAAFLVVDIPGEIARKKGADLSVI